jgi:hypothetical protein
MDDFGGGGYQIMGYCCSNFMTQDHPLRSSVSTLGGTGAFLWTFMSERLLTDNAEKKEQPSFEEPELADDSPGVRDISNSSGRRHGGERQPCEQKVENIIWGSPQPFHQSVNYQIRHRHWTESSTDVAS